MAVDKRTPVLVVDDYKTMVRIVRNLLHRLGFEDIDDANDGASALPSYARGASAWSSRTRPWSR